jgi:hypothetical protein
MGIPERYIILKHIYTYLLCLDWGMHDYAGSEINSSSPHAEMRDNIY